MLASESTAVAAITRRVVIEQLRDYRLLVLGIGTAFLLVFGTYVSLLDYAQRMKAFTVLTSRSERNPLEAVLLVRVPPRLLFMSEGGESTIPSTLIATPGFIDTPHDQVTSRRLLPPGVALDWSFTFAYIFSLAVLMCTADLVIRQRAVGVLRIVMSYPVKRARLLFGEYLGAFAALVPFVIVALLAGHILVIGSHAIDWGVADTIRSVVFAALTLAFLSFVCLVGVGISTTCRDRTACQVTAIAFWVLTGIVLPALAGPVAHSIARAPSEREHRAQLQQVQRRFDSQIFVSSEMLYPLKRPGLTETQRAVLVRDLQADLIAQHEAKLSEYKQSLLAIRREYIVRTEHEARLATGLSLLSPFAAYTHLADDLAGSGAVNQDAFYAASERFLRSYTDAALELRQRLRPLARVSGPTVEEDGIKLKGVSSVSYGDVAVDRGALPTFSGYDVPLRSSLVAALAGVLAFLAIDVVVFSILVYRFNRYVFA